ncbi:hypothetical protein CHH49_18040 [Terribacillus saccharophilus]|uniref:hypothetical protein n=1 Tax=Terribacillus saccharophilus TaxID=361277 RepID=UPI000BA7034A|nr:hypothetical protein [Terribacillus saccharophilus]PAF20070.1 hypothetical protein CHH49_18040 [Terribacillus saccharophilus]
MKNKLEKAFTKVTDAMFLFIYIMVYLQFYPGLQSVSEKFIGAIIVGAAYGLTIAGVRGLGYLSARMEAK